MLGRRRVRLGVAVGLALLGSGGGFLAWPHVRPADPDAGAFMVDGHLMSRTTGYVTGVDVDEGLLKVSSTIFGLRPVTVSVADDTTITIRDKQGALADLAIDMPVRVA